MRRYFLIFYKYESSKGVGVGECDIYTNGSYPSRKSLIEELTFVDKNKTVKAHNIIITNIVELSEKDYKNWKE